MSNVGRLLLVDDHALLRDALRRRLDEEDDLEVVAVCGTADEALVELERHNPDVVLMDIDMPGMVSFEAARRIRKKHPATRVIFVSAFFSDRYIESAISSEAAGYVTKAEPPSAVIEAIRVVMSGGVYFSEQVRARLVTLAQGENQSDQLKSRASLLTKREIQVLRHIAQGLARKEIADVMNVSLKTVESHCTNLMSKLGIHDRVELTRFAIREGLVEP